MNDFNIWPKCLKSHGITIKIYRRDDRGHWEYKVDWYVGTCRRQKKFSDEDKALAFAQEQMDLLVADKKEVAEMSKADRDSFVAAMRILRPLGVGLVSAVTEYATAAGILSGHSSLAGAATDYTSAVGILDGRSSLIEAARDFVAKSEVRLIPIRVGEAVEEMISIQEFELKKNPKRRRDVQTMRCHLRQFARFAKVSVVSLTADVVMIWLRKKTASDRNYNNKRTSLGPRNFYSVKVED